MNTNTAAMACPIDGTALVMSERSGIEIDYCPACRGVWLDRGELDKIIERNAAAQAAPVAQVAPQPRPAADPYRDPYAQNQQRSGHHGGSHYPDRKRKKSFLEELFD